MGTRRPGDQMVALPECHLTRRTAALRRFRVAVGALHGLMCGIEASPEDPRRRTIRALNERFRRDIGRLAGADEVLLAMGWALTRRPVGSETTAGARPLFAVGDAVEGRYRGGAAWYPARVVAVDALSGDNFVYSLQYDDGDAERAVRQQFLRSVPSDGGDTSGRGVQAGGGDRGAPDEERMEEGFILREPSMEQDPERWVRWFDTIKQHVKLLGERRN